MRKRSGHSCVKYGIYTYIIKKMLNVKQNRTNMFNDNNLETQFFLENLPSEITGLNACILTVPEAVRLSSRLMRFAVLFSMLKSP